MQRYLKLFWTVNIWLCLSSVVAQGNHNPVTESQDRGGEPKKDAVGNAVVKCRSAFQDTGLVDRDDNDIVPGKPNMGFEYQGCAYTPFGVYRINTDAAWKIRDGELLAARACVVRFPNATQTYCWTSRWFSKGASADLGAYLRMVSSAEDVEKLPVCPVDRIAEDPKKLNPYTLENEGSCLQSLSNYFTQRLSVSVGINYARRILDGTWRGVPASEESKKAAQATLKKYGLPLADGIEDKREKLFEKLNECRNVPLPSKFDAFKGGKMPKDKPSELLETDPEWWKGMVNASIDSAIEAQKRELKKP